LFRAVANEIAVPMIANPALCSTLSDHIVTRGAGEHGPRPEGVHAARTGHFARRRLSRWSPSRRLLVPLPADRAKSVAAIRVQLVKYGVQ
jgi:hypothetical protein